MINIEFVVFLESFRMPECAYCGNNKPEFVCSRCNVMHYCSPECQSGDWELHKNCCSTKPYMRVVSTATHSPRKRHKARHYHKLSRDQSKMLVESAFASQRKYMVNPDAELPADGIFSSVYECVVDNIKNLGQRLYAGIRYLVNIPFEAFKAIQSHVENGMKGFGRLLGLFNAGPFKRKSFSSGSTVLGIEDQQQIQDFWKESLSFTQFLGGLLKTGGNWAKDTVKDVVSNLSDHVLDAYKTFTTTMRLGADILDRTLQIMKMVGKKIIDLLKIVSLNLKEVASGIFSSLANMARKIVEIGEEWKIRICLCTLRVIAFLEKQTKRLLKAPVIETLKGTVGSLVRNIANGFAEIEGKIADYMSALLQNPIVKAIFGIVPEAIRIGSVIYSLYFAFFPTLIGILLQFLTSTIGNYVVKIAHDLAIKLRDFASRTVSAIVGKRSVEPKRILEIDEHAENLLSIPTLSKEQKVALTAARDRYRDEINLYYDGLSEAPGFYDMILDDAENVLRDKPLDTSSKFVQQVFSSQPGQKLYKVVEAQADLNWQCMDNYISAVGGQLKVNNGGGKTSDVLENVTEENVEERIKTLKETIKQMGTNVNYAAVGRQIVDVGQWAQAVEKLATLSRSISDQISAGKKSYTLMWDLGYLTRTAYAIANFWELCARLPLSQLEEGSELLKIVRSGAEFSYKILNDLFKIKDLDQQTARILQPEDISKYGQQFLLIREKITEHYAYQKAHRIIAYTIIGGVIFLVLFVLLKFVWPELLMPGPAASVQNDQKKSIERIFDKSDEQYFLPAENWDAKAAQTTMNAIIESSKPLNDKTIAIIKEISSMASKAKSSIDNLSLKDVISKISDLNSKDELIRLIPKELRAALTDGNNMKFLNLLADIEAGSPVDYQMKITLEKYVEKEVGELGLATRFAIPAVAGCATAIGCPLGVIGGGIWALLAWFTSGPDDKYSKYKIEVTENRWYGWAELFTTGNISSALLDYLNIFADNKPGSDPSRSYDSKLSMKSLTKLVRDQMRDLFKQFYTIRQTQVEAGFLVGITHPYQERRDKAVSAVAKARLDEQMGVTLSSLLTGLDSMKKFSKGIIQELMSTTDVDKMHAAFDSNQLDTVFKAFSPEPRQYLLPDVLGSWAGSTGVPILLLWLGLSLIIWGVTLRYEQNKPLESRTAEQLVSEVKNQAFGAPASSIFRYAFYGITLVLFGWAGFTMISKLLYVFLYYLEDSFESMMTSGLLCVMLYGIAIGIKKGVSAVLALSKKVVETGITIAAPPYALLAKAVGVPVEKLFTAVKGVKEESKQAAEVTEPPKQRQEEPGIKQRKAVQEVPPTVIPEELSQAEIDAKSFLEEMEKGKEKKT